MSCIGRLFPSLCASLAVLSLAAASAVAQSPAAADGPAGPAVTQMAARIDALLAESWANYEIEPAPLSDDAEFLRRVSLDLTGVIPTVAEVRSFVSDQSADKRGRLIDRLLVSHSCADHLATTWRNMMVPRGSTVDGFDGQAGLQNWLRTQFLNNLRYDQLVADLLVATGAARQGPGLFYTAFDLKPEELAGNTARVFLGIQIQCAQCHDHPFDRWTQQDFWGYAAFFARLGRAGDQRPGGRMQLVDKPEGEVQLPGTQTVVPPKYPRGDAPSRDEPGTRRMHLGIWMVSRENSFLSRAAVNRSWAHMFGRGLVEPVDDLNERNPASHPQLFDELTSYFVETGFDLRNLLRTLANTRAYQRTSRVASDAPTGRTSFARMSVKSLTPEQLYDSLRRAALSGEGDGAPAGRGTATGFDVARQTFVAKMQSPSASRLDYDAGVAQVLQLLNGTEVETVTTDSASGLLAALEAPIFSDAERVEILFLATLSRPPRERELARSLEQVAHAGSEGSNAATAFSDILWALVNSAEFGLNH